MSNPIFIARQDTLEQEILPAHWLSQYKLFGEESYTFQDKEIWKKLCMSSAAANDRDMHAEALEEMLTTFSAEHTGKWMLTVYGMDAAVLEGLASMAAVAGNGTAMAAVAANALLMHAITNSETAMRAIANSQTAMHAIANSETAMQRIANSTTAMDAIGGSKIARDAVQASPYYNSYIKENDMAIAKLVVALASLESAGYSGMAGVAADSTAMNAVAASSTAMTAVVASSTAMTAVAASSTAMNAVVASSTAMNAVVASSTAMNAVVASSTAMTAVAASATAMGKIAAVDAALSKLAASTTAMDALYARKKQMKGGSASKSGKFIILEISQSNTFNTSKYGYATLSDGSKPDWSSYLAKYAFFQKYPKYATYMLNDTDSDDYIYYFDIASP